ncbi:MAG: pyridoxal phosphate-dependent aminotransferase [Armatimonadetes bacterium]|nr:pyridoxal phosphate-dependent aminotransferase [Armatimonadota bacterium]
MSNAVPLSAQTGAFQTPALRRITLRVREVGGINLAQGVCNLAPPPGLFEAASRAMEAGHNRYTDPRGLASLRRALAEKAHSEQGLQYDPDQNVFATQGATGAFEAVCGVLLNPGDKVALFEPTYPYHTQALRRLGAEILRMPLLAPDWSVDWDMVRGTLAQKPKFILVNTPGNPTGKVWTTEELDQLAALLDGTDTLVITDEIYEHMVFDGRRHVSPATRPGLRDKTITISGFSKTFAITGWRIGSLMAPSWMSGALTSYLDAVYVCPPAPLQQACAEAIGFLGSPFFESLSPKYQAKRDFFADALTQQGFTVTMPQGAYYMLVGYEGVLGPIHPDEAADQLIDRCGVGAVPASDFVQNPESAHWLRFCLVSEDNVLQDALARLAQ